ncbi:DUF3108 domain-containing protein [Rheinheimera sp.]|uniref:DUF3108 domain-containing protein n=1 Tax=Rheinheimera sp. TaxID=1869214 RepID=UPI0027BA5D49|nr:DUF3108 domain-containing protein [Rheinheimera sp.]
MMMTMNKKWRLWASFFCLTTVSLSTFCSSGLAAAMEEQVAPAAQAAVLQPFEAKYLIYRSGKKHGEASRYLKSEGSSYELGYHSKISWLIFSDERNERSRFYLQDGRIKPTQYLMQRSGTGPSRHYELNLDWADKSLKVDKSKKLKKVAWNDNWLDLLSFHSQIVLDLQAGKTDFVYDVLNRHGESRNYKYKVATEEWLSLPFGKIKAIRIERYGQSPDKQVYAWVAPELGYLLVRLWQSEDNVEQFDVQLESYQPQ